MLFENLGGTNGFAQHRELPGTAGSTSSDLAIVDVTGDSLADVVFSRYSPLELVYSENLFGNGTFADAPTVISAAFSSNESENNLILAEDVTGDARIDVVASVLDDSFDNTLALFTNADEVRDFASPAILIFGDLCPLFPPTKV